MGNNNSNTKNKYNIQHNIIRNLYLVTRYQSSNGTMLILSIAQHCCRQKASALRSSCQSFHSSQRLALLCILALQRCGPDRVFSYSDIPACQQFQDVRMSSRNQNSSSFGSVQVYYFSLFLPFPFRVSCHSLFIV